MSLQIQTETETLYDPVFLYVHEDVPGGISIMAADLPTTLTTLEAGTPLGEGNTAGEFHVCKTAVAYAASSGTALKVTKNHTFVANDYISNGGKSVKINSISTTNAAYDTLTLNAALAVTLAMVLYLSTSAGTEPEDIAQKYIPMGVLKANVDATDAVANSINLTGSLVVRGTVKESILPYSIADVMKTSLTARIRFA